MKLPVGSCPRIPLNTVKGHAEAIANRIWNNMSISSIIIIAGLKDNKKMNKNQRKRNMAVNSKTEGIKRKHVLK